MSQSCFAYKLTHLSIEQVPIVLNIVNKNACGCTDHEHVPIEAWLQFPGAQRLDSLIDIEIGHIGRRATQRRLQLG